MAETFDPYRKWLGIQPKDQPPNHYRLLGLELYETDLDAIEGAADRVMGFVRQYQSGEHAAVAAKILNEIATARLCLLKPASKAKYDATLKQQMAVPETTKADGLPFDMDAELAEMMKSPNLIEAPKPVRKSKRSPLQTDVRISGPVSLETSFLSGGLTAIKSRSFKSATTKLKSRILTSKEIESTRLSCRSTKSDF